MYSDKVFNKCSKLRIWNTEPGMFNLTEGFQADRGHAHSFKSSSTQRCRAAVLSASELSSEAQRAAIHQAVMDFTLAFMSSVAGRERESGGGLERKKF